MIGTKFGPKNYDWNKMWTKNYDWNKIWINKLPAYCNYGKTIMKKINGVNYQIISFQLVAILIFHNLLYKISPSCDM